MAGRATLLRFHNRVTGFVSPPSFTSQNSLAGKGVPERSGGMERQRNPGKPDFCEMKRSEMQQEATRIKKNYF